MTRRCSCWPWTAAVHVTQGPTRPSFPTDDTDPAAAGSVYRRKLSYATAPSALARAIEFFRSCLGPLDDPMSVHPFLTEVECDIWRSCGHGEQQPSAKSRATEGGCAAPATPRPSSSCNSWLPKAWSYVMKADAVPSIGQSKPRGPHSARSSDS